jgi:hypothetical protein
MNTRLTMPDEIDWRQVNMADLHPRLMYFAALKIRRLRWRISRSPEDFVHEAIIKTMSGTRPWRQEKRPLLEHLCLVIASDISSAIMKFDNRLFDSIDTDSGNVIKFPNSQEPSQEDELIEKDLKERFISYLKDKDATLSQLAEIILFQRLSLCEQCSCMNITNKELENMKRRLYREADRFANRQRRAY